MTSTSSFGHSSLTLQFELDRDIDSAAQDVQAAINTAAGVLPRSMPNPPTFNKVNPADPPILTLVVESDTLPLGKINDFADTVLSQKLSQLYGVGLVSIQGNQKPAIRVRVNPSALAKLDLSLEDVRAAVMSSNLNAPKGSFDGKRQSYAISTNDQIITPEGFRSLIIAYKNGSPVRISDVGEVVDGVENNRQGAWVNGKPAVLVDVQRQPGANIIETANRIKDLLPLIKASHPPSIRISIFSDRTETIRASVRDVQFTLVATVALVVMVIFVFLRKLWATVIPSVAVPLAIVGTFGVMKDTRPMALKVGRPAARQVATKANAILCSDCPLACKHLGQILADEAKPDSPKAPREAHPVEIFAQAYGIL
jgi:multidrug efflux pump subunit AcrB